MDIEEERNKYRYAVTTLKYQNIKSKDVQAQLKDQGVSYTVRNIDAIYQQFLERGTSDSYRKYNGKSKMLSEDEENEIVEYFHENPTMSLRKFARNADLNPQNLSHTSISNILKRNGLNCFKLGPVLPLNDDQKSQRLNFAIKMRFWKQKWKRVYFSDEIWFEIENSGSNYGWAEQKNDLPSQIARKKNDFPKKIHLWGMIGYSGPKQLKLVTGNLNSKEYIQIIEDAFDEEFFKTEGIFQQDQAKFHVSQETLEWLEENQIEVLPWPPKGADLNIIEQIWAILKQEVFSSNPEIKTIEGLFKIAEQVFFNSEKIKSAINKCYNSLPSRIEQVIAKKGDFYKI